MTAKSKDMKISLCLVLLSIVLKVSTGKGEQNDNYYDLYIPVSRLPIPVVRSCIPPASGNVPL